jgi:hypothetical protein
VYYDLVPDIYEETQVLFWTAAMIDDHSGAQMSHSMMAFYTLFRTEFSGTNFNWAWEWI